LINKFNECAVLYRNSYIQGSVQYRTVIDVPIEGYKTITVRREVYEELKNLAERTHRSVSKLIEHLIQVHGVSEERRELESVPVTSIPNLKEAVEG